MIWLESGGGVSIQIDAESIVRVDFLETGTISLTVAGLIAKVASTSHVLRLKELVQADGSVWVEVQPDHPAADRRSFVNMAQIRRVVVLANTPAAQLFVNVNAGFNPIGVTVDAEALKRVHAFIGPPVP